MRIGIILGIPTMAGGGNTTPPAHGPSFLREDSGYILREDGSRLLRE